MLTTVAAQVRAGGERRAAWGGAAAGGDVAVSLRQRALAAGRGRRPGVRPRPLPRAVRLFALTTIVVSVAAFVLACLLQPPQLTQRTAVQASLLVLLTALAWRYPVQFGPKSKVYITSAATFAGALLLPPWLAMASAAVGVAVGEWLAPGRIVRRLFNVSALSLNVLLAAAIVSRLTPADVLSNTNALDFAIFALAAVVHYSVNAALVESIGGIQQRRSPLAGLASRHRRLLPQRAALYVLGIFTAMVGNAQPVALLFGAVPAWAVYRSLRDGALLRSQTRGAVEELADIVDMRDRYTSDHSKRVAVLSQALAQRLKLPAEQTEMIVMAARVHDVGKIGIRSSTLFKPEAMDDEEWAEMRSHPEIGARLISRFPDFSTGMEIVLHHHERWDGKGYPGSLAGANIPFGARLVAVADTFDAMTSHRAYRRALPAERVLAELQRGRGAQFDPELLDQFLALLAERPEYLERTDSGSGPRVVAAG
jgi:HD-GYP domain-containing protein (c-di-GMP phosphodiesterase class II)